jgi:hypothetical protein
MRQEGAKMADDSFKMMTADRAVVEELHNRLIAAFEGFAREMADRSGRGLRYMDALMGCHNFYKAVILDLERRCDGQPIGRIALETLADALDREWQS